MQRRTYHLSGHVQGVGFRYTAQAIASRHSVSGYVRNLPDGRVEVTMEGDDAEMDQVLQDLNDQMADHIRRIDLNTAPATGEFKGFSIRY